jgi:hypothetical protein
LLERIDYEALEVEAAEWLSFPRPRLASFFDVEPASPL